MTRTRIAIVVGLMMGAIGIASPAQADILIGGAVGNGNAETGMLAPWVPGTDPSPISSGAAPSSLVDAVMSHGAVGPAEGSYFFSLAEADTAVMGGAGFGDEVFMRQSGAIPVGATSLVLSGFFQTDATDVAEFFLQISNAAATMSIEFGFAGDLDGLSDGVWKAFSSGMIDLTGLAFSPDLFRVTLKGTYQGTAMSDLETDVFYDDVVLESFPMSMQPVPEPSTYILWALTICCVGFYSYRRWKLLAPQTA